jgi:hypothetical protein
MTMHTQAEWYAEFDSKGIPAGTFNERFLMYATQVLGTNFTSVPAALQALADSEHVFNWSSICGVP